MATTGYIDVLDDEQRIALMVWFENDRAEVTNYSVVLVAGERARFRTIRLYDGAHGLNEMHRYTKELGKRPAELFHRGTLGEGMRMAVRAVKNGYEEMIDGWRRG